MLGPLLVPTLSFLFPQPPLVEEQQQPITTIDESALALVSVLSVLADQVAKIHTASRSFRETLQSSASSADARLEVLAGCASQQLTDFSRYQAEMETKLEHISASLVTLNQDYVALKAQFLQQTKKKNTYKHIYVYILYILGDPIRAQEGPQGPGPRGPRAHKSIQFTICIHMSYRLEA